MPPRRFTLSTCEPLTQTSGVRGVSVRSPGAVCFFLRPLQEPTKLLYDYCMYVQYITYIHRAKLKSLSQAEKYVSVLATTTPFIHLHVAKMSGHDIPIVQYM